MINILEYLNNKWIEIKSTKQDIPYITFKGRKYLDVKTYFRLVFNIDVYRSYYDSNDEGPVSLVILLSKDNVDFESLSKLDAVLNIEKVGIDAVSTEYGDINHCLCIRVSFNNEVECFNIDDYENN